MLYIVGLLLVSILFLSLVFYKYSIDTGQTIKELRVDRDTYRKKTWDIMKLLEKERKHYKEQKLQESSAAYVNLKNKIKSLQKDIEETDFNTFENVKEEIVSALKQIDSYGEQNDKS